MNSLFTMTKKELLEITRSKKLLVLIILFAFIAISSPIMAKLLPTILKSLPATPGISITLPEPTAMDAIDQLIKNLSQIGMIVIIIMFSGSIADEKSKKTLELVLSKPISRPNFILSKFLASIMATKIVFLAAAAVFYTYTISILGAFSLINFVWLSIFLLIFLILILSLTLFFSTLANSQITAVGLALLTEIIIMTVLGYIEKLKDYSPSFILGNYKELITDGNAIDFLPSAITSLVLIMILIFSSVYSFKRQEVER